MTGSNTTAKRCTRCQEVKPLDAFYLIQHKMRTGRTRRYRASKCKPCDGLSCKEWRQRNPDYLKTPKIKASHAAYRNNGGVKRQGQRQALKKLGIANGDVWYANKKLEQGGVCAICSNPQGTSDGRDLCIDHNHTTMSVRGLLCGRCNLAIGLFRESQQLLQNAANYLSQHS